MLKHIISVVTLILCSLILLSTATAKNSFVNLSADFTHLLDITTKDNISLDIEKIETLIKSAGCDSFLNSPEFSSDLKDLPSASYGFTVNSSLKRLLKFCYNTKIPGSAVLPGYVRLSKWQNNSKNACKSDELWRHVDNLTAPVIKKGMLYMQNTPDIHTGAYYGYNSFKSAILLRYKNKNVLISVSKQKDISEVGKKGFILGNGENLDFFYSGEPGLNKFGLGSIKSYLYDAFSVTVYVESETGALKCVSFKWLKGGWAGMNMIKAGHIKNGLKRFARQQKELIESDTLPPYDRLISTCSKYNKLSDSEMITLMKNNLSNLMLTCSASLNCPKFLKKNFNPDMYISRMTKEEMKASLILKDMKSLFQTCKQKPLKISLKN